MSLYAITEFLSKRCRQVVLTKQPHLRPLSGFGGMCFTRSALDRFCLVFLRGYKLLVAGHKKRPSRSVPSQITPITRPTTTSGDAQIVHAVYYRWCSSALSEGSREFPQSALCRCLNTGYSGVLSYVSGPHHPACPGDRFFFSKTPWVEWSLALMTRQS